jgi:hypothetical protein
MHSISISAAAFPLLTIIGHAQTAIRSINLMCARMNYSCQLLSIVVFFAMASSVLAQTAEEASTPPPELAAEATVIV